jgi:hypothetical protein
LIFVEIRITGAGVASDPAPVIYSPERYLESGISREASSGDTLHQSFLHIKREI